MNLLRAFRRDSSGAAAVLFAVSALPILCCVGAAVDYGRAAYTRTQLQTIADSTSLQAVISRRDKLPFEYQSSFRSKVQDKTGIQDVQVQGQWILTDRRFRVEASATVPTTIMALFRQEMEVAVLSTAETSRNTPEVNIVVATMEPEAGDYNELTAYCHKPTKNGGRGQRNGLIDMKTGDRIGPVRVTDNSNDKNKPDPSDVLQNLDCDSGENLSFQLHNVRDARTSPSKRKTNPSYDYYTDTTVSTSNRISYNTNPADMIETVHCKTLKECEKKIPTGKNRTPQVNREPCIDGFMYMGWEDRPPNKRDAKGNPEWTDRDYDDIRIIMSCKAPDEKNQTVARLVE